MEELVLMLEEGGVVAMKGTGGFHLACSAFSEEGVKKLRTLKKRDGKPFALMFRDVDMAGEYVGGPAEEKRVVSWRRPIVLLPKKQEITPGLPMVYPGWE